MDKLKVGTLIKKDGAILRILSIQNDTTTVIDCIKQMMPKQISCNELNLCEQTDETVLPALRTIDQMSQPERKTMHTRFTMISPVIPFIHNEAMRADMIVRVAELNSVSKQTVRKYLCMYLAYQKIEALAPMARTEKRELSTDEKNFRWALNRFFYTQRHHTLTTAYNLMLKEKYTNEDGTLVSGYPPFHRFRYYYTKTKKPQRECISRDGLTSYQRNSRPLLGTVQDFAPSVGVGMLDSTVCDIYLTNDSAKVVGRPLLTLCVDAYSSLIMGYFLSWEGGTYSLQGLMDNVIADKVLHCASKGISIAEDEWNISGVLPAVLVTDKGKEYTGSTFEQITELGLQIVNLPPYRPELKGIVERAFCLLQGYYKPHLKGKGVIQPDFQQRGGHDYRKDACLTMAQFEQVIIRCILHYNNSRIIGTEGFTPDMLNKGILPHAHNVWNYAYTKADANFIAVDSKTLNMTLLPRTKGTFTRRGLSALKQRYRHCEGNFTSDYLNGGPCLVAYDPADISIVWVIRNGEYFMFELILKAYEDTSLAEITEINNRQKAIKRTVTAQSEQAKIDLITHIETIASFGNTASEPNLKDIRHTRKSEISKKRMEG